MSDTEPELGLGIVLKVEFGRLEIFFPAAGEHRQYAPDSAPVRRVQFAEGDVIRTHEDDEYSVESVHIEEGLIIYRCGGRQVPEAELSDTISFSKPEDRLMGGQVDELPTYDLRVETLLRQARFMKSPVRGFLGGRVDLLPHQMGIASEVSGRLAPRVLLADEVGLGKTIEAGLILHRLHLLGKADRILVLLPEPLLHQWFVELLRKFNLLFSLFDEERCTAIEANDPEANPFLDSQLILCSTAFATSSAKRSLQLAEAGWDLLIVDEAHHLEWSPEAPGASYSLVAEIAGPDARRPPPHRHPRAARPGRPLRPAPPARPRSLFGSSQRFSKNPSTTPRSPPQSTTSWKENSPHLPSGNFSPHVPPASPSTSML